MRVGSLFSGIGGIERGFKQARLHTRWFIENDAYARGVLRHHFPDAMIYEDVTTIDWQALPPVEILTGGFPCQDASIANTTGRGIDGPRTSLWRSYRDAIRALRPKYALLENVPHLCHRGFDRILCDLALLGYDAEWQTLSARSLGAPHLRKRLFLIAYPHRKRVEGSRESHATTARLIPPAVSARILATWQGELPTPRLLGVAHGIPDRVHRTRCLGNAVIPQLAELIARRIKDAERNR